VQRTADHNPIAVACEGERDGLVGMGGAAGREPADVGAPEPRRSRLGLGEHARGQLHRVQPGVERSVAGNHIADEVGALLVARDGEWGRPLLVEAQPGVQQRGITA